MKYIIVGLGNPGLEYAQTRHNTGRIVLETLAKKLDFPDWQADKKLNALKSEGKIGKNSVILLLPETFMNNSGKSVKPLIDSPKKAKDLVVVQDDIDLAFGTYKMSFNRGSGGHKGIESIIKAVKTKEFLRIRVGVSSATPKGKIKKPQGEEKVVNFIIGKFKPDELKELNKEAKKISEIIEAVVTEGKDKAMNRFN